MIDLIMSGQDQLSLAHIKSLDERTQRIIDARLRFLVFDLSKPDGLVPPKIGWDVVSPAKHERQRHPGGDRIIPLTPRAAAILPTTTTGVWELAEGGRISIDVRRAAKFPMEDRYVRSGRLDRAKIAGDAGTPIEIARCQFDACHFLSCKFEHIRFVECDFLGSAFDACYFGHCSFDSCHFQKTSWGNVNYLNSANVVVDCINTGRTTYDHSKGIGCAVFMPPQALRIAYKAWNDSKEAGKSGAKAQWTGQELRVASAQMHLDPSS